ncbi:MAG: hypothetical protein ACK52C_01520, partial [Planctomycetia bacterium]
MATTSPPDADISPIGEHPAAADATPGSYSRETLRSQIELLRREAAVRARLEKEIVAEHEDERKATLAQAEQKTAATNQHYAREMEATKQEYKAILQKLAAQAAADQQKLDQQRKTVGTTIARTSDKQARQLQEDDQFEEGSFKEIYKEKRKDPVKLFMKVEKELGRTLGQLDAADADTAKALARWGATVAAPAEAGEAVEAGESGDDGAVALPSGAEILTFLEQLRAAVVEQAKAIVGLKEATSAFAGGTTGAAVALPLLAAIGAAAGAFFGVPGDLQTKAIAAGVAGLVLAGGGIGGGLWFV